MAGKIRFGKSVPILRPGLTVDDLKKGTWYSEPNRWKNQDELPFVDEVVDLALQRLIDHANSGDRVHRRAIIATLCQIGDVLRAVKDIVSERMGKGELIPTVLDEIAGA